MSRTAGLIFLGAICAWLGLLKMIFFHRLPWSVVFAPLWAPFLIFTVVTVVMLWVKFREAKKKHPRVRLEVVDAHRR